MDRTGHESSPMISLYARQARTWAELNLGPLLPLDTLLPEMKRIASQSGTPPTSQKPPARRARNNERAASGSGWLPIRSAPPTKFSGRGAKIQLVLRREPL
ncbi:MAG: hypothetical protein ACREJ3_00115 [Polyangiaceae bacterium]